MDEQEILARLDAVKHTEGVKLIFDLLAMRRERYRDKLESTENEENRGRAKECKDLLAILR